MPTAYISENPLQFYTKTRKKNKAFSVEAYLHRI